MTVYLAGSIRDGNVQDIEWREHAIQQLSPYAIVLNPLAGKSYDAAAEQWTIFGEDSDAKYIVKADFWCVDRADIILFDFRSLAEGYPSIGTLTEFGRSTTHSCLRFAILAPAYKGHNNRQFPGLHPFLEQNVAKSFLDPSHAVAFVQTYCMATAANDSNYWGGASSV